MTSVTAPGNGQLTVSTNGTGLSMSNSSGTNVFTANQSGNNTITINSNATALANASTLVSRDVNGSTALNALTANSGTFSGNVRAADILSNNGSLSPGYSTLQSDGNIVSYWTDTNTLRYCYGIVSGGENAFVITASNSEVALGTVGPLRDLRLQASGTVIYTSDIKLKKNIETIPNALDKVLQLRGVEFDWKESGLHSLGFIAQEVEKVVPDLVSGGDEKGVAYQNFVALLVEAIKELTQRVTELENK